MRSSAPPSAPATTTGLEAAARYLHAVGTPLVEIYEALLARLVDFGPEWISGPRSDPEREIGGFVDDVVNRLGEDVVPPTRGTVMLAGIATRHVLGLSAQIGRAHV